MVPETLVGKQLCTFFTVKKQEKNSSFSQVCWIDFVAGQNDVGRRRLFLPLPQLLQGLQGRVRARHVPHHGLLHRLLHSFLGLQLAGPFAVEPMTQVPESFLLVHVTAILVNILKL